MIHMPNERRELLTLSKLVQHIQESGSVVSEMATESNSGLMVPDMKENGKTIGHMAKASSHILMVIFMKAIGSTIRLMATVFTTT